MTSERPLRLHPFARPGESLIGGDVVNFSAPTRPHAGGRRSAIPRALFMPPQAIHRQGHSALGSTAWKTTPPSKGVLGSYRLTSLPDRFGDGQARLLRVSSSAGE